MIFYENYYGHSYELIGKRKKYDNTVYTLDIETSSYFVLNDKVYSGIEYKNLSEDEKKECEFKCLMYIWMLSINNIVYYGRTWEQLKLFLDMIEDNCSENKIIFIHNLSFEFQFLKSHFEFTNVLARISHKVMKCEFEDYNIELRCSYMMSNCALKYLTELYDLPVEKLVGDLDYTKIRHNQTILTTQELKYCENDCLVVYYYILEELKTYKTVNKIPLTSTGHVRRELKEKTEENYAYKSKIRRSINIDPHIYNLLMDCFAGGYTHANWIYADEILYDIDSFDFTSSYPYVLVTHKYPSTKFKKCNIKDKSQMLSRYAYILKVKLYNIKSKYYNNFISQSKCYYIKSGRYDNGRIIAAEEIEICLTDIDFNLILDTYTIGSYEIEEAYFSHYNYLPKEFIEFILDKYVNKTKFKNVEDKKLEYIKEKNKFNALYGMSVTNMIRDKVIYNNEKDWSEVPLENEEIEEALKLEEKKAFLSFSYGVWVTAYARNNLIRNIMKLDKYVAYCDTDSIKVLPGYNKKVIDDYNEFVKEKIKKVSKLLEISIEKFAPTDIYGKKHMLGLFENDEHYKSFKTEGAKKYAYTKLISNDKLKDNMNIIKKGEKESEILEITVAGVPKKGALALKTLDDFKDDFVFEFEYTNKNLLVYCDNMSEQIITDYQGKTIQVTDKTGCCLLPTSYKLGKSLEYANLISEKSSKRSRYKE